MRNRCRTCSLNWLKSGLVLMALAVSLTAPQPAVADGDGERSGQHHRCPQHRFGQFSDWSEPVNLGPVVNSEADDFHPAISPNGLSLYISSGRLGGLGGSDIWVSQRASLGDAWGPPQNLGPNINSTSNDIAPDISPD